MIKYLKMGKIQIKSQSNPIKIKFTFGFHRRRKIYGLRIYGANARINLTDRTVKIEKLNGNFYRKFLGGRNIAAYLMLQEISPEVKPLGPENKIIFTTSVLTGTPIPGTSRFTVAAKSPLTGGYGESEAGGWWGPELKFAGFDAIIVEGRSREPVYIWIDNGNVEIRSAQKLWGKETGIVQEEIKKELGDEKIKVLQIVHAEEPSLT